MAGERNLALLKHRVLMQSAQSKQQSTFSMYNVFSTVPNRFMTTPGTSLKIFKSRASMTKYDTKEYVGEAPVATASVPSKDLNIVCVWKIMFCKALLIFVQFSIQIFQKQPCFVLLE